MKSISRASFTLTLLFASIQVAWAQIDLQCNGRDMHAVYLIAYTGYYRMDSVDTNPTNPIYLTNNSLNNFGISINNNLDSVAGPVTMYSCANMYYFWNGTGWTYTNHNSGVIGGPVNPGGSANYIFNLADNGSTVFRYDGVTNTQVLTNVGTTSNLDHDVAADNQGNFYLFYTVAQKIVAYTPNGIPIDSFATTGFVLGSECGLAILGDRVYANTCTGNNGDLYEGIKSGNTINFTMIKNIGFHATDIASCPSAALPLAVFKDPEQPHFAVYPNPAHEVTTIKLVNTSALEIYNSMGQLITTVSTRGLSEYQLDVSEWTAGVYLINAFSDKKTSVRRKLVVE